MAKVIALKPSLIPAPALAAHYLCETWWTCHTAAGSKHHYRKRLDSILATGQAISVIPPAAAEQLDLVIVPAPGWKGYIPTWFGIPCRIGRVEIWFAMMDEPGAYEAFSLLALFPRRDLEDAPPFVQLGTQFLLEHAATIRLDCASAARHGRLVMP